MDSIVSRPDCERTAGNDDLITSVQCIILSIYNKRSASYLQYALTLESLSRCYCIHCVSIIEFICHRISRSCFLLREPGCVISLTFFAREFHKSSAQRISGHLFGIPNR